MKITSANLTQPTSGAIVAAFALDPCKFMGSDLALDKETKSSLTNISQRKFYGTFI